MCGCFSSDFLINASITTTAITGCAAVVLDGAQPGPLGVPLGEREEFAFSSGADSGMEMGSLGDTKASPSSSFEHPASAYSAYEPASHGSMPVYNPTTGGFGIHPESSERVPQVRH